MGKNTRWVTVRPQVMDTLVFLSERHGEVVTTEELMDQVWSDVIVGSGSIYNCINELRKVFEDNPHEPQYIETVSKRGYRLTAPVQAAHRQSPLRKPLTGVSVAALVVVAMVVWKPWLAEPVHREAGTDPSIAVLPFADLSPNGDQAYFADGITEELLNSLAVIEGLQVAARTSSFHFRNKDPMIDEVGKMLGVGYVLEGSVRRAGERVRITAQLIEVADGYHLWSQTYERTLEDVFAIQDEIALAIVDALVDELALPRTTEIARRDEATVDIEAWSEYLLGLHLLNRRTPDDFEAAIAHLEKAIDMDPQYAPAQANLATTYWLLHVYDRLTAREAYERARPFAERALELDPRSAQAHAAMWFMEDLQNIRDPEMRHLNRALELNPSYADALNWKANELKRWRRYAEAEATARRALQIDPLSMVTNSHFVFLLLRAGHHDEAADVASRLMSLDAGWGARRVGSIHYDRGDYPAAVSHYLTGLQRAPGHFALGKEFSRLLLELGLAGEASRVYASDRLAYYEHLYAGEWASAIRAADAALAAGGEAVFFVPALARAHYLAREYEQAASYYRRALPAKFRPGYQAEELADFGYVFYAMALRESGDAEGATRMLREAADDVQKQQAAGYNDGLFHQLNGMVLLYQERRDEALASLEAAFDAGYRQGWVLAAPLFDPVRNDARFIALDARFQSAARENLAGVLAVMCGDNPAWTGWRPLPDTCQKKGL
ncbi:MAG: winged helix-turn-helix domain-containing protein [Woeseiaceae bacterium]|nr:winged helix-turn-helix domain-containing protein [Woeseiaceae bacterium]